MKFIKPISIICLAVLCGGVVDSARAVNMTSQIQRLLDEKQRKMEELEKCEGKKKGFMIAGLSTIGLTAVGVGVNVALANKSGQLSEEIEDKNAKLESQQSKLDKLNTQIWTRNQENRRNAWTGAVVGADCGNGIWTIAVGGTTDCMQMSNASMHKCNCVKQGAGDNGGNGGGSGGGAKSIVSSGVIGNICSDADTTKRWIIADDGDKTCLASENTTVTVRCKCAVPDGNTDKKQPKGGGGDTTKKSSFQVCLESRTTDEGKACCYVSASVAKWENGKCQCLDAGKKFDIASKTCKGGAGTTSQCKKGYGEELTQGCICDSTLGLMPVLDDMEGKRYCDCPTNKPWNTTSGKCEARLSVMPPAQPVPKAGGNTTQCKKGYGEELTQGCICDSALGLTPVLDDMEGKRYCDCPANKPWNTTSGKCEARKNLRRNRVAIV